MPHAAAPTAPSDMSLMVRGVEPARLPSPRGTRAATLIGGSAVLIWSTAASLAVLGTALPPLLFLAGAFGAGFTAFVLARLLRGQPVLAMLAVPLPVLALMVLGFLGHNGLYVLALRHAPAAQVNLVSYLWPLLMVTLLGVLGIARPTRLQVLGTLLSFAGLACFVAPELTGSNLPGLAMAFLAASCFAIYSALRARVSGGPPDAAGTACGVAAVLALGLHIAIEPAASPDIGPEVIIAMILIGVGPMGLANRLWDHGVRFGDGRILSAFAYLTPVLSTLLLVMLGLADLTAQVVLGGGLILSGIALSAAGTRKT